MLADADDVVLGFIREHILQHLEGQHIGLAKELDEENDADLLGVEVELLALDVDIAGQDVVKNDVLDERALVVLLVVESFDITERNCEYLCDLICLSVLTLSKGNAIILVAGADKSVGVSVGNEGSLRECELLFNALLGFSDLGELAARYNDSVLINSTDGASYYVLQLMDNVLE